MILTYVYMYALLQIFMCVCVYIWWTQILIQTIQLLHFK